MLQAVPPPPPEIVRTERTQVDEIVVTGARLPPAAGDAAFSVIRLTVDDIEASPRLDEALAQVPAVSLFRRNSSLGANPTTQGLSLRAVAPSGAGRALVTLDGVPLNDPFGGWVIWSQLPTEAVGGLDIVRGAGAGPYGAGALTGAVVLRERDTGSVLDLSAGERGAARAGGWAGTQVGDVRLSASGLYETSDGYTPVRGARAGAADTPLAFESRSGAVRADIPVRRAVVSLRAGVWREDRESGLAGASSSTSGSVLSVTAAAPPTDGDYGWRLQAWRRESDLFNSSVSVAADRATTTPAASQDATPTEGWGLNAALRRRTPLGDGRLEWEVGADARRAEGETQERFRYMAGDYTRSRVAGGEQSVAGLYGDASWTGGPWLVAGGLRIDRWDTTNGRRLETDLATGLPTLEETPPDRSGEVFSARLAVRRDLGETLAVRAAAYSGFRPPSLNELHRPFRVGNDITEANAALEPERLTGVELGVSGLAAGWAWSGTLFWNRVEDAVVNVTIGEGPGTFPRAGFVPAGGVLRQRQNAGTIEAIGVELEVERTFGAVTIRGALSAAEAEMDGGSSAPQLTGLRPAQAAPWSATAGIDWAASERLTLAAALRWEGRRFDDDLNSRVLEAGGTVDARAEWRLTDRAQLWLAADKLFDREVEVSETGDGVAGFGPPRTLRLGVRLTY